MLNRRLCRPDAWTFCSAQLSLSINHDELVPPCGLGATMFFSSIKKLKDFLKGEDPFTISNKCAFYDHLYTVL